MDLFVGGHTTRICCGHLNAQRHLILTMMLPLSRQLRSHSQCHTCMVLLWSILLPRLSLHPKTTLSCHTSANRYTPSLSLPISAMQSAHALLDTDSFRTVGTSTDCHKSLARHRFEAQSDALPSAIHTVQKKLMASPAVCQYQWLTLDAVNDFGLVVHHVCVEHFMNALWILFTDHGSLRIHVAHTTLEEAWGHFIRKFARSFNCAGCKQLSSLSMTPDPDVDIPFCNRRTCVRSPRGRQRCTMRQSRRPANELTESEKRRCPWNCCKFYRCTSSRSIQYHVNMCPNRVAEKGRASHKDAMRVKRQRDEGEHDDYYDDYDGAARESDGGDSEGSQKTKPRTPQTAASAREAAN